MLLSTALKTSLTTAPVPLRTSAVFLKCTMTLACRKDKINEISLIFQSFLLDGDTITVHGCFSDVFLRKLDMPQGSPGTSNMFNTVSEISKWTHQIWTLLIKLSQDQLIWAAPHSIYSFVSLIYNNCSLIYSGIKIFDPPLILYVCLLTNKWSVYSFNGRFIWTMRDRITTKKSRKIHQKVINWFAF